jgi:hypothetical protein
LAITLLCPGVDGSRPINNLEKENDMPSANGRAKASRLPGGSLEQMTGFGMFMAKAVLNGRGDEIVDLAKTNLWR